MRSKRWIAVLLCSAAGVSSLMGCGDDSSSNTNTAQPSAGTGGSGGAAGAGGVVAGSGGAGGDAAGAAGEAGQGGSAPLVPVVDLRADTNRDGNVDLEGDADDVDEDSWDKSHGAIFLANIDNDDSHCAYKGSLGDEELAGCHDGTDDIVNGEDDLLDLARLKTAPWADAPDEAVGRLTVSEAAAPYVRLFKSDGAGSFTVFNPAADVLTADEVRAGVELAIEASDVIRDTAKWDGYVDISFNITLGEEAIEGAAADVVRMRVSPVMTHHHLQPAVKAYVSNITGDFGSIAMRADLKEAVKAAGVPEGLLELKNSLISGDQWTQDFFETAYMAMPTAGGNHVIRVAYRSANVYNTTGKFPLRPAGRVVFSTFLGKDFGAIQQYDVKHPGSMDSLNSFGNTETIPPYTLGDKSYPLGRLYRGSVKSFYPDKTFSKLMESQQVQPPVYVDTSWLLVGHVDETISFVKVDSPRGWAVVANDPGLAKKMLEDQVAAGNGDVKMFVGKQWANFNGGADPDAEISIKDVLADKDVMAESAASAAEVDNQIEILKKETGITDDEIIRLPYLHENAEGYSLAYQVGTVNGIYLADGHFGSPKPHGPLIDGKDIFETQMTEAFAKVGITVHYIEDWDLYHRLSGEVHCGSNVIREVSNEKWWESGY